MHKYSLLLASLVLSPLTTLAQENEAPTIASYSTESYRFTLDDCLKYAFGNSYERQNLKLSEQSAAEMVTQAKNNRNPNVNLSAGESAQHVGSSSKVNVSGNVGINGGITLYQGGSITNNIKLSQQQEEEAKLRTQKYDNSLSIEILSSYLSVLRNEETLKYKTSIVSTSKEQADMGKKKYDVGTMLESDYLILEAQYAANQTDTLDAYISRSTNLLSLKKLLSMAPEANLELVAPDTSTIDALALLPSQEECVSKALQTMPELKLSKSAIEITETQTAITKGSRRPTISASAGIGTSHRDFDDVGQQLGDNFSQQVGVSLSMPIYDRGQTKSKLEQNRIAKQQAEIDYAQTELNIRQTVIQQYQNVKLAYERYKMTKLRCNAYGEVFKVYNAKFNVGMVVITDMLQRQDNYINAINEYVQAKYAFILNRKILDIYTGENISMGN
ncbi:MAG: TolC family protein [Paludibacteraceae bacterium]|nr:TolC family protein [Paludibacteraceae bacterium]